MINRRERGEDPEFETFIQKYGDFFPENPQSLDELLEIMAKRMANAQAMLNSMTPEQREQMRQLSEKLLEDMDLRWQMSELAQKLQTMFPQQGWGSKQEFTGEDPMGFGEARCKNLVILISSTSCCVMHLHRRHWPRLT
jgi:uncharacterized protein with von Willebrand factor type A (vWA) domain